LTRGTSSADTFKLFAFFDDYTCRELSTVCYLLDMKGAKGIGIKKVG
jgi:hypothetical protein